MVCKTIARVMPAPVPIRYPSIASNTPTGASAGACSAASKGAEATPPMFASEAMPHSARSKRNSFAASNIMATVFDREDVRGVEGRPLSSLEVTYLGSIVALLAAPLIAIVLQAPVTPEAFTGSGAGLPVLGSRRGDA